MRDAISPSPPHVNEITSSLTLFLDTTTKMKVVCAALCVQAVGAFIAPSVIKSGESNELFWEANRDPRAHVRPEAHACAPYVLAWPYLLQ